MPTLTQPYFIEFSRFTNVRIHTQTRYCTMANSSLKSITIDCDLAYLATLLYFQMGGQEVDLCRKQKKKLLFLPMDVFLFLST